MGIEVRHNSGDLVRTKASKWEAVQTAALWAVTALLLYILVSCSAYAIAHPDMTSTRRFLNTWDALTWDWNEEEASE